MVNFMLSKKEEYFSNEHMGYAIVSHNREEHEEEKLHIQSACPFDEDFFRDIEAEVVDKVPYNINDNKKYIIHFGNQSNRKWNTLHH